LVRRREAQPDWRRDATKNLRVAYEVEEQPNDQFKVTWNVSTTPSRPLWLPWRLLFYLAATVRGRPTH
jgi:hypothetical protein